MGRALQSLKGNARKAQPGGKKREAQQQGAYGSCCSPEATSTAQGAAFPEYCGPPGWKASSWLQFQACILFLKLSLDHVLANVLLQRKVLILKIKFTGDKLSGISACLDQETFHPLTIFPHAVQTVVLNLGSSRGMRPRGP